MSGGNPWSQLSAQPMPGAQEVRGSSVDAPSSIPAGAPPVLGAVAPIDAEDRLPRRRVAERPAIWVLGVHGGSGESTLARLLPNARPAAHSWPLADVETTVLLVSRTHAAGLRAAQLALTDWASGSIPGVRLAGLVLAADAPQRPPVEARDFIQLVSGAAPATWEFPWIPEWRGDMLPGAGEQPRRVAQTVARLVTALRLPAEEARA